MTKRPNDWDDQVNLVSLDDDDVNMEIETGMDTQHAQISQPAHIVSNEADASSCASYGADSIVRRAKMYQEYMKMIAVPMQRGSVIPCNSWMELAKSLKGLYKQPLHYLTNVLLKQWDQGRFEAGDDHQPLDITIHPVKAETTVWLIEEVHRQTASFHQLAKLWLQDPMYHAFVDPIFPKI